jgi:hypothetical protein
MTGEKYFLLLLGLGVAAGIAEAAMDTVPAAIVSLIDLAATVYITVMRVRDVGYPAGPKTRIVTAASMLIPLGVVWLSLQPTGSRGPVRF